MTRDLHIAGRQHADKASDNWWREAVIYQIYPKSWADGNGDGMGDLAGIRSRLPYLADLGIDAIWFSPFFVGPQKDGGYDVSDYRDIDPIFGDVAEAEKMIADAHALGIKILIDVVPNHTSNEHKYFKAALATPIGSPEWERYHVLPGKGENGELPPNNWESIFFGSAWTQIEFEGKKTGHWYLHVFDPAQPDVNWNHPDIHKEFEDTLRFWFDRGVDGFRIDVAHGLIKAEGYPEHTHNETRDAAGGLIDVTPQPYFDQPGVHEIYRKWRSIANEYTPQRIFVGEIWVSTEERLAKYLREDELHTGFNFGYLSAQWHAKAIRHNIENSLRFNNAIGAPTTWVTENHDVYRSVNRWGLDWPTDNHDHDKPKDSPLSKHYWPKPEEIALGRKRARAAMLLMLALPGSAYVWQGQELGLEEVRDIPDHERQDPEFINSGGLWVGRDGCRVPLPWTKTGTTFGFGPDGGAKSWLTQPKHWGELSVEAQQEDADSMWALTRSALHLRKSMDMLGAGELKWREDLTGGDENVIAFERVDKDGIEGLVCVANLSKTPVTIPATSLLLGSLPELHVEHGKVVLPQDSSVWVLQ